MRSGPGEWVAACDGSWVRVESVRDTGRWECVYNLRVADFHTYFVGGPGWGFSVWAHNAYTAEVNQIIKQLVVQHAADVGSGFSHEAGRTGRRGEWATREYLVQHLLAMLGRYYPGAANRGQIADCAATRILTMSQINRDPQAAAFVPQQVENYRPTSPAVPALAAGATAHQQYKLTKGGVTYTPTTADLNHGGWEVQLGNALGDPSSSRKAQGVYVIRDTATGRIYKVGKSGSTGLVRRLESYAEDFVTHGFPQGIRITAEVYKLRGDYLTAERVLRGAIDADDWDLTPASGAADGTSGHTDPSPTGGWSASHV